MSNSNTFKVKKGLQVNDNDLFVSGSKVGINTNQPKEYLHVNGTVRASAYKVGTTSGISQTVQIADINSTTHTFTFKNGILTGYSAS